MFNATQKFSSIFKPDGDFLSKYFARLEKYLNKCVYICNEFAFICKKYVTSEWEKIFVCEVKE